MLESKRLDEPGGRPRRFPLRAFCAFVSGAALLTIPCVVTAAQASAPPSRSVLVSPTAIDGTAIGGFSRGIYTVKADTSAFDAPSGLTDLTWTRDRNDPTKMWAQETRFMDGRADQIGYYGPLRTNRGDRSGTSLGSFRRRWPEARVIRAVKVGGSYPGVSENALIRHGRTTAIFAFAGGKLRGVEIGLTGDIDVRICIIPECRGD